MKYTFYKYQGTGNDFILIDDRQHQFDLDQTQIEAICDRRFGIGADGVILLREADGVDFEMKYYNSDGRESSMCGNGGRCLVSFARWLKLIDSRCTFMAADGIHHAEFTAKDPDVVKLGMKDVNEIFSDSGALFADTGSPHIVIRVDDSEKVDVVSQGRKIRYNQTYASEGVNVNFVEVREDGIKVRTYERGVENETLSCGTGVTASALCARNQHWIRPDTSPIEVACPGGILNVYAEVHGKGFRNVWLEGEALYVFKGELDSDRF